jgi:hypothetical protein
VTSGEPTIRLIANLGEAYYEYFRSYRNYFRMYYFFENPQVQSQVSPEMMDTCIQSDRKIWNVVTSVFQRGIDEGLLHKNLDPLEASVILWSNSNGLMRIMDRQDEYWRKRMGLDLENMLRRSNQMLVEAMMTEEAQKQYPGVMLYHEKEQESPRK